MPHYIIPKDFRMLFMFSFTVSQINCVSENTMIGSRYLQLSHSADSAIIVDWFDTQSLISDSKFTDHASEKI